MPKELSSSAQKVQDMLYALGFSSRVVELPDSTRTAKEAAQAIGCQVAQIVKSLVFRGKHSNKPLLVVASGTNRVNEQRLRDLVGEPIEKAGAEFVRQRTGFVVGGVPPIGHTQTLATYIDHDLLAYDEVWAAAGTPNSVFPIGPHDLVRITGGSVADVAETA